MAHGASIRTASTAERPPAALADTALRNTAIIAIPPVLGANTPTRSTAVQRPAPAAAHPPMTMQTIRIAMVRGRKRMTPNTSARKPALPAEIPARNMPIMWTQTVTANVMTAARTLHCSLPGTLPAMAAALAERTA